MHIYEALSQALAERRQQNGPGHINDNVNKIFQ